MSIEQAGSLPSAEEHVSFRHELWRKAIHLCSLSIPIIYYYVPKSTMLWLLIPALVLFMIGDILRQYHEPTFRLYTRIFGRMLRQHEKVKDKKTFNGATWVFISASFCVLLFPKLITISAFAILIISDTTAAIFGRRFGTRKYRGKTLEGSTAFVVSAAIVILFTPKIAYAPGEYLIGVLSGLAGAVAEVFSFDIIDDNFAIPVGIGFALWALYAVFFPQLNVFMLDV